MICLFIFWLSEYLIENFLFCLIEKNIDLGEISNK